MKRAAYWMAVAAAALLAFSACPSKPDPKPTEPPKPKEDTGKPIVEKAKMWMGRLKGQVVLTKALAEEIETRVEALTTIPEDIKVKKLKKNLKLIKASLDQCYRGALEQNPEGTSEEVDVLAAGENYSKGSGVRVIPEYQAALRNLLSKYKRCEPAAEPRAKKKLKGAYLTFVDNMIEEADALRKLLKRGLPDATKMLAAQADQAKGTFDHLHGKLKAELKNKDADQAAIKKHLAGFQTLKTELEDIAKKATALSGDMNNRTHTWEANALGAFTNLGK